MYFIDNAWINSFLQQSSGKFVWMRGLIQSEFSKGGMNEILKLHAYNKWSRKEKTNMDFEKNWSYE